VPRVLFLSPGYPSEMPHFVRGLAEVGAEVLGVGDGAPALLSPRVRGPSPTICACARCGREDAVVEAVKRWLGARTVDRVECLWEPGILLAARIREAVGAAGPLGRAQRALSQQGEHETGLDDAGIRTPRHRAARGRARCGRGRDDRLPVDRQACRGRRLGRHPSRRERARARDRDHGHAPHRGGLGRGVHRRRGVHLRHRLDRRRAGVPQHRLVPSAAARRRTQEWISPQVVALRFPTSPSSPAASRWPARHRGARLRHRLHPHGVVSQVGRRGGVRRDRRPPAGRAPASTR